MKEFNGKKMLDHIFIDRKTGTSRSGYPYDFQVAAIHVERFINELKQVPTDEKGFARFNISSRRDDASKYNFILDDWKPTNTANSVASNRAVAQKPAEVFAPTGASDDLPF